jgi:predicted nucleic acid-binding protein
LSALICDTSGLLAYFDGSDNHHDRVREALDADIGPFVVSPFVVAELDYLLSSRCGVDAELAALDELAGSAWDLAQIDVHDLRLARTIVARYKDQDIGVTDASLVVLAERYKTARILTFDQRHFRVLRSVSGEAYTLIP